MVSDTSLELTVDGIAQGGDGVGRHDGLVVFARGGLPGERVRLRLTERKPSYARGEVLEVLSASPDRVAPTVADSDHAPWQHIAYPAQLRLKETILREQLAKLAGVHNPPIDPIIAAPRPWGYRNTAHLHARGAALGYYAAGTRELVPLAADPLLLPALNEALSALGHLLPPDIITGVTLRASSAFGYSLALLHDSPEASLDELELLAEAWRAHVPSLAGVVIEAPGPPMGAGAADLHDALGGIVFSLAPTSFFQVNVPQAAHLLELVSKVLEPGPGSRLLDLYSGVGAFALPMAAAGAEVTAVEEYPDAVADGERSADLNNIDRVRFLRAPVERALPALDGPFDGAVLDPPRRGCHPAVLEELARLAPPRLVYISCHPGILGRDLPPLLRAGYRLERLQPVDLFPQTPHIETVVVLGR
ncbi:MAG: class I SAM-dependent RNA methyltransferase [Chloroflexales bacterium]|nr:class I SAM-dependent RNA methyltransferase [Chloroflexales bacterium]